MRSSLLPVLSLILPFTLPYFQPATAQGAVGPPGIPQCATDCSRTASRGSVSNFCTPAFNTSVQSCIEQNCNTGHPTNYGVLFTFTDQCQAPLDAPANASRNIIVRQRCTTLPQFGAFIPIAEDYAEASRCSLLLFGDSDCTSRPDVLDISTLVKFQCVTRGGGLVNPAAYVSCNASDSDLAVAKAYIANLCPNTAASSGSGTATVTPSSLPPGSGQSGSPVLPPVEVVPLVGLNGTAGSGYGMSTSQPLSPVGRANGTAAPVPFTGGAVEAGLLPSGFGAAVGVVLLAASML